MACPTGAAAPISRPDEGELGRILRLMLSQAQDHALILLDARSRIIGWRMSATRVFGYEEQEVLGQTVDFLFVPEDRARAVPKAEVEIADKVARCEDDRWLLRKDGVRIWVSGILTCLRDGDGRIAGYSKLLRDRTDAKEQTEALRTQAASHFSETQRQGLMVSTLAHELRNPLGVLANAVQLIELAYPGDPKLSGPTQLLSRQVKYLSTLIDDLLEDARIRQGKVELSRARLDLYRLLGESVESVSGALRDKSQNVEMVLPQTPMTLYADETRLKQVFVNLLANASKFSERGAKIWVKVMTEGDEAVVRFEDRGRGISADALPRIFSLFSQADVGENAVGLGLGLALVKQYVEMHGGTVQARSEGSGRGSEFIVRLPLAKS